MAQGKSASKKTMRKDASVDGTDSPHGAMDDESYENDDLRNCQNAADDARTHRKEVESAGAPCRDASSMNGGALALPSKMQVLVDRKIGWDEIDAPKRRFRDLPFANENDFASSALYPKQDVVDGMIEDGGMDEVDEMRIDCHDDYLMKVHSRMTDAKNAASKSDVPRCRATKSP